MSVLSYTIEECKRCATNRGGDCLSFEYDGCLKPMNWRCKNGHTWTATFAEIKRGSWCSECSRDKIDLFFCQKTAKDRQGKCLSLEYKTNRIKMEWECFKGHRWTNSFNNIKNGQWCPKCNIDRTRKGIEHCRELVNRKKGKCLSDVYENNRTKLLVECDKGHQWETNLSSLSSGDWCRKCGGEKSGETRKIDIALYFDVAKKRGGKCLLSKTKPSIHSKVEWECCFGHRWFASYSNVLHRGSWCPTCKHPTKREKECREVFKKIFGREFLTTRPKWLKNKITGKLLELDGYEKDLGLAFEYDGEMHYKTIFGEQSLEKQELRDREKDLRCEENGVVLIRIPYFVQNIEEYINQQLHEKFYKGK